MFKRSLFLNATANAYLFASLLHEYNAFRLMFLSFFLSCELLFFDKRYFRIVSGPLFDVRRREECETAALIQTDRQLGASYDLWEGVQPSCRPRVTTTLYFGARQLRSKVKSVFCLDSRKFHQFMTLGNSH